MANVGTKDLTALNDYVDTTIVDNFSTIAITVTGTWVGILTFQGSENGSTFDTLLAVNLTTRAFTGTTTINGQFLVNCAGLKIIRVKATAFTSGPISIDINANGAFSGIGRTANTLYDSSGSEFGTTGNPINTAATFTFAPELLNGRLFSTSIEVNAANSGTDNPLVLFRNPTGSGKNVFIYKIVVGISTANVAAVFKVFGSVTVSANGTAMSAFPLKRVTSPTAAISLVNSLPTITAFGDQLITIAQGQNTTPPLLVDSAQISLEPNKNLLITADPNSNNRTTTVTVIWSEVPQ